MQQFFNTIRGPIFGGRLKQEQVEGLERLLEAWIKWGDGNLNRLAKVLATVTWETGRKMRPVKETERASDIHTPKDETVIRRLNAAWKKGQLTWVKKPYWREGWFGRGDVQLTHEANYKGPARKAVMEEFGVDIWANRDLVLRGDISAFILIKGSLEGWFTGKKMSDYIDDLDEPDAKDHAEYMEARRVINGKDRAREIADLAIIYERALRRTRATLPGGAVAPDPVPEAARPAPSPTPPNVRPKRGIDWGVVGLIALAAVAVLGVVSLMF